MPASRRAPTVASCRSARIDVTGAHVVLASSHARRRCESSRFGVVLAILGLLTQIAGSGLHPLFPIRSANGVAKLAVAHALCLANGDTAPRRVRRHRLTKRRRRTTILPVVASGTVSPVLFLPLPCSSSQSRSLHLVSRTRHRRRKSQRAFPAPFAPVPLRQE